MAGERISADMPVGAVVAEYPQTMRMLESLGIDYCCGGKMTLAQAAEAAGMPVETVLAVLHTTISQAAQTPSVERNWQTAPLDELTEYILTTHHTFMKSELPRIQQLLDRVLRAHGAKHGEVLEPLVVTFAILRRELEEHLAKEEETTFPAIKLMLSGTANECVRRTLGELEEEHETAGAALARMRHLTHDYQPPEGACNTFRGLYTALQEMEQDLHRHIHLENNILFPRARQLAASLGQAA
ncbi:MAG: iron-sulfur cluster repair di-iron protein [Armatimonadota bacterium]